MSIQILPARLANQIAAGEVVERPASVIKELVENSLDAKATSIKIDIDKGGIKRICISDNGIGIHKDELTLALSRHATSKIRDLNDLEGISSLGFRGEALASISSVARLTLTSKPESQDQAWQAHAEGRDMDVTVQPAAHPNGTTIEVNDLFFNTPARRKFLRTEKTEFNHIDEVLRRIALAQNGVTFVLSHNGKVIRQYRAARQLQDNSKRVAQICGQRFIDHAVDIHCKHDNIELSGWIATPEFHRSQNDLCYSYVNGRMMRDKLINHAIRQAYADFLPNDVYPAFVLFLSLDYREVDVNVHPAKHEVRFHQGRYVHDFIFSVCHQALSDSLANIVDSNEPTLECTEERLSSTSQPLKTEAQSFLSQSAGSAHAPHASRESVDYIAPLTPENPHDFSGSVRDPIVRNYSKPYISAQAKENYQALMTPIKPEHSPETVQHLSAVANITAHHGLSDNDIKIFQMVNSAYALVSVKGKLKLLSLSKVEADWLCLEMTEKWRAGIISQPLLLPVKLKVNVEQLSFVEACIAEFELAGISIEAIDTQYLKVRKLPAMLRHKDVSTTCFNIIDYLMSTSKAPGTLGDIDWKNALVSQMLSNSYTVESSVALLEKLHLANPLAFIKCLDLNSVDVDLTSEISQLTQLHPC